MIDVQDEDRIAGQRRLHRSLCCERQCMIEQSLDICPLHAPEPPCCHVKRRAVYSKGLVGQLSLGDCDPIGRRLVV